MTSSTTAGREVLAELAEVDLAVAGDADRDDLAVDLDQEVLQGGGGRDAEVRGEGLDGRGVGGVQLLDRAVRRAVDGLRP